MILNSYLNANIEFTYGTAINAGMNLNDVTMIVKSLNKVTNSKTVEEFSKKDL